MEKTYLSISITYFNLVDVPIRPEIHYYRSDDKATTSTFNKLTVAEANQLMWELVKLGGKNEYSSNWFNSAICTRKVTFWGRL